MTFEQFFSSDTKARLIKFFLLNPGGFFQVKDIASRLGVLSSGIKTALKELKESGFLKSRNARFFSLSYHFPHLNELKALAAKFPLVSDEWILQEAKRLRHVKFLVIAGALIHMDKGRVEILIVGDGIRPKTAETFMKKMESRAAQELRYVLLTSKEFLYRKKMFDRFVLDVLELPHRVLVQKIKIP